MSRPPAPSFLTHFAALRDPRQRGKVLYPLPEILLLLLCATVAGADDFVEIGLWGCAHLPFLRRFLRYRRGIPSHDTLCEVIAVLDPALFKACFLAWVETLRGSEPDLIAIDGKTSRRSHDRAKDRSPLHLVSAWATKQRLVLGQEATEAKSNEITAIPLLLERLELRGALVTIDAMGTQTKIAQKILDRGGDYLLALKENWPATYAEVETLSRDSWLGQRKGHALGVQCADGLVDRMVEVVSIDERLVRKVVCLEVVPDAFDIVQLGRIFRQPFEREPMRAGGKRGT